MRLVEEGGGVLRSLHCERSTLAALKAGSSPLAQQILALVAEQPQYSSSLAKLLKQHEQKIYYHLRKLEQAGLLLPERREQQGVSVRYYRLASPAFAVLFKEPVESGAISTLDNKTAALLAPFIVDGKADFKMIVGSPDAHGPRMTHAKDGSYAIDLALFLGTFLTERGAPVVKLDTECTEDDLQQNLIIIGGPLVNTVAERFHGSLPIRFDMSAKSFISQKQEYQSEQIGVVVKAPNPSNSSKSILWIAGRSKPGTKAAILAVIQQCAELSRQQRKGSLSSVVEGKDLDSDGIVDAVLFKE